MISILVLAATASMGQINFPVTGNAQCNKHFSAGMLALHSFMYDRAHKDFQAALKADPNCAMAAWGDAMAYNHPIWGEDDLAASRKALELIRNEAKLSKRELAFVTVARALFSEGSPKTRLRSWLGAAEKMCASFPRDEEAALQLSLALIANSERLSDQKKLMQAAALAFDVMSRKPNHPGAAHYAIHACDTPDHAILALPAAERYAKIAPAASHALHMPSHIFVMLGMWDRVEASNIAAWAASENDSRGLTIDKYDWHSFSWLFASSLELGKMKRAEELLRELRLRIEKEDNYDPRFAYALMLNMLMMQTNAWATLDEWMPPLLRPLPKEEGDPVGSLGCAQHAPGAVGSTRPPFGLWALDRVHLLRAEKAMLAGDEAAVRAHLAARKPIFKEMEAWRAAMPAGFYERVALREAALVAGARAYKDKSEASLKAAADAFKKLLDAGDPWASGPSFEAPADLAMADLYLAAGQGKNALAQYESTLVRHPRMARALRGAAQAAKLAGDVALSDSYFATLKAQWQNADAEAKALLQK